MRGQPAGITGGVTVDAHDDHRLAQALALVALRSRDGLTITGAESVAKSYPTFFAESGCSAPRCAKSKKCRSTLDEDT